MKHHVNNDNKWIKKFFQEGKISKMKGLLLVDNPYEGDKGTAWEAGWYSIEFEDESIETD
jgi:hypothetical protein